jgi:hypothetical protein
MLWQTTLRFRAMAPMTLVFPLRPERGADTWSTGLSVRPSSFIWARSLLMAIADLAPKFAFVFLMAIAPLAALVMPALVSVNPAARCLRALFKPASQPNICRPLDADHLP